MAGDNRLDGANREQPQPNTLEGLGGALLSNPEMARMQGHETPQQRTQREYDEQHGQYLKELDTYWQRVDTDKAAKQIVSDYPPIYKGPARPPWDKTPPHAPSTLPNLHEMTDGSKQLQRFASGDSRQPDFSISSIDESTFKQRYAAEATRLGNQYGFGKNDVENVAKSIYAFEDGGWGTYETLSNMTPSMVRPDKPGDTTIHDFRMNFRPGSTALGYNQLLMFNSVRDVHEHGADMASELTALAKADPSRAKELNEKAKLVSDLSSSLDKELKVMSLVDPAKYVAANGKFTEALYSDFAKSKDATEYSKSLPTTAPAQDSLTRRDLSIGIHGLNLDGDIGPLIQATELGKLFNYAQQNNFPGLLTQAQSKYGGPQASDLIPAALELANLAGTDKALAMITPANGDYPTVNWFERAGYEGNPVTNRRTAHELLLAIYKRMDESNSNPHRSASEIDFDRAFTTLP